MEKLDNLVAGHIEDRLLQPERLEEVLASVLDRRQERTERRREHIAELNKRAAETDLRLKRLYDAVETGVADLDDPALKERIAGLKAIRDQSQVDADRAQAMAESVGHQRAHPDRRRRLSPRTPSRPGSAGGGRRQGSADHGIEERSAQNPRRRLRRKTGYARRSQFCSELAEGVGFEPTVRFHAHTLSKRAP